MNGFVELSSPQQVRLITEGVRTRNLEIEGHASVKIKPALTDIDRNRNSALMNAETLVNASQLSRKKTVTVKKGDRGSTVRGVYVNDVAAFTQADRFARGATFVGGCAHLKLLEFSRARTNPLSMSGVVVATAPDDSVAGAQSCQTAAPAVRSPRRE